MVFSHVGDHEVFWLRCRGTSDPLLSGRERVGGGLLPLQERVRGPGARRGPPAPGPASGAVTPLRARVGRCRDMTRSMRDLEIQLVELQSRAESTGDRGLLNSLKSKKRALANLLGVAAEEDLLEVFNDCLERGRLPLSCRRAVITLLPKKGDLQELKNWRPVSLLCTDYKIMSKVLASRLREAVLVDFFWDRLHWVPQSILFLPKEEGGQGLVHLASRGAAFRLQFLQRLLTGPADLVWRRLSCCILQRCGGLRLCPALFLMDCRSLDTSSLPAFYRSVFSVWILLRKQRREQADSLYWLLQEPVLFGGFLDCPSWSGPTLSRLLRAAGVSTLGQVVELAGPRLDDPVGLAAQLGLRSTRIMGQILKHWRQKLTAEQFLLLNDFCYGSLQQNCEDPFPSIRLFPDFKNCSGPLLELAGILWVGVPGGRLGEDSVQTREYIFYFLPSGDIDITEAVSGVPVFSRSWTLVSLWVVGDALRGKGYSVLGTGLEEFWAIPPACTPGLITWTCC
ncbi:hypothetical protein L3Q82_003167 [Scortum barcoo]|uniref:Uncharacterized protein n=1 Tax=Scortum barcoo TaxID=214431 RepID=A0ACB8VRD2_9TELE|nr:hypothetical protein L3Q82_003167 [Scortum barcoo]